MSYMFCGFKNITNLDLSSFDTKNATNISGMFYDCNNLKSIKMKKNLNRKIINLLNNGIKIFD